MVNTCKQKTAPQAGFTLIEVSIVLLIIGLITGGVFVGQELIRAAQVRAQIRQIESFDTAISTFRLKYNGLPGDLRSATDFGFVDRSGEAGHGDGNGVVDGCLPYSSTVPFSFNTPQYGCENALMWRDLSQAGFIEGGFTTAVDADVTITTRAEAGLYFPKSKLTGGESVAVQQCNVGALFIIGNIDQYIDAGPVNSSQLRNADIYGIDNKIDDGKPLTGKVQPTYFPGEVVIFATSGFWCLYEMIQQPILDCATEDNQYNIAADSSSLTTVPGGGNYPKKQCFIRIKSQAM